MNNEPVAWMTFDGEYSYELMLVKDNEDYRNEYIKRNGEKYKDWVQPLYTHPAKTLNDGGEPVKNATYWKRQHDGLLMKLNTSAIKIAELEKQLSELKYEKSSGVYDSAKTLTDEEIGEVMYQCDWQYDPESFARAILRKASEK